MKLLFDQNISPRIIKGLSSTVLSNSSQVRFLGLENASDLEIFEYAKSSGYTVVTFDSDFVDLSLIKGIPPKIIWLKTGNLTTSSILKLLEDNIILIDQFLKSDTDEILEVYK